MERLDARRHGIAGIQDHLVVEPPDDLFYAVVVKDDPGALIRRPFDPDLDPPLVAVQPEAFPPIVDQAVGRLEKNLFVYPGCHP
jgi:hypothetical protein